MIRTKCQEKAIISTSTRRAIRVSGYLLTILSNPTVVLEEDQPEQTFVIHSNAAMTHWHFSAVPMLMQHSKGHPNAVPMLMQHSKGHPNAVPIQHSQ